MELISQIDNMIEIVTSCSRAAFDVDMYAAMVKENYIPPASFGYIKSHWVSRECIRKSATWFEEIVKRLGIDIGNLGEIYLARGGFTLAFLLLKHVLEYEFVQLPGDVRGKLELATVDSLDLDTVVGHLWPIVSSAGVDVLYVLRPLRERLERGGLRLVKRLVTPLAVFGIVSDVLHASGMASNYFTATGFGRLVNRLMDIVLDSMYIGPRLHDVAKTLVSALRVHEEMLQDPIRFDWRDFALGLSRKYKASGGLDLYTAEDILLDVAHFVLAAANHYEIGGVEIRALLHRLRWGNHLANPCEVRELVVKWAFAKLIRVW